MPLVTNARHIDGGVAAQDAATAHLAGLPTQAACHARDLRYRAGKPGGQVSCPAEAPLGGGGRQRAPKGPRPG